MNLTGEVITGCCKMRLWSYVQESTNTYTSLFVLQRESRRYFGCPTLNGLELENLGGPGTQSAHWKKRLIEVSIRTCKHLAETHFNSIQSFDEDALLGASVIRKNPFTFYISDFSAQSSHTTPLSVIWKGLKLLLALS